MPVVASAPPRDSPSDRLLWGGTVGAGRLGLRRCWEEEEGAEEEGVSARSCPAGVAPGGGGGALRVGVGGGVRRDDRPVGIVADLCLCSCLSLARCRLLVKASSALCSV